MHRKLILDAFTKAKEDLLKKEGINASVNQCAKYLEDYLTKKKFSLTSRTLSTYHTNAKSDKETTIKREKVIQLLCEFLGYKDYEEFAKKNNIDIPTGTNKPNRNRILLILVGLFVVTGVSVAYFIGKKECWMEWQKDSYKEVPFDAKKASTGKIIICNPTLLNTMKLIQPNCNSTVFFTPKGNPAVWYQKRETGKIDYFTHHGLHPETGKTLKPITQYIIDKYICK